MIYVFTVATNCYVDFLEYQLVKYKYLFQNKDKKFI
jgi:hypothetical protein